MNKVTFNDKQILVNGVRVGWLEGTRSEVWVILLKNTDPSLEPMALMAWENRHAVARFKYNSPTSSAKRWLKWSLERFSTAEVIEGTKKSSPMEWAESFGYDPLTPKRRQELEAYLARIAS